MPFLAVPLGALLAHGWRARTRRAGWKVSVLAYAAFVALVHPTVSRINCHSFDSFAQDGSLTLLRLESLEVICLPSGLFFLHLRFVLLRADVPTEGSTLGLIHREMCVQAASQQARRSRRLSAWWL